MTVKMGEEGESLLPGTVYLAPDLLHMGVSEDLRVVLSDAPAINGCKPSATFLFNSVAVFGAGVLAVIMTGGGDDGIAGLHAVKKAGGHVWVQDERSSVIFGMPAKAIEAGLAELAIPLDAIAPRIREVLRHE